MEYKYYDNFYLDKIVKDININPYYSITQLEDYLSVFPQDYIAYTFYLKVLVDTGRFEDALSIIERIENSSMNKQIDVHFRFVKLRALVFLKRYEEAYQLYVKYKDDLLAKDPRAVVLEIIYAKENNLSFDNVDAPSQNAYFYNQFINYNEKEFLDHIKKHLSIFTDEVDIMRTTVFNSEFPYKKVIEEIKKCIPNEKRIFYSFFNDVYVFKYDFNGRSDNRNADYFRVICTHDTNHLITMYPYPYGEFVPYTDLNYLNNSHSSVKVRRMSQIDKFNQKYKK